MATGPSSRPCPVTYVAAPGRSLCTLPAYTGTPLCGGDTSKPCCDTVPVVNMRWPRRAAARRSVYLSCANAAGGGGGGSGCRRALRVSRQGQRSPGSADPSSSQVTSASRLDSGHLPRGMRIADLRTDGRCVSGSDMSG